jgi:hypothetical protein
MNPVDEYLMTKTAATGQAGNWKPALRNAAIQAGVGLAAAGLPIAASRVYNAVNKGSRFRSMMEHNEDLGAFAEQDPKRFAQFYDSLHKMSPEFASDPVVAGTYMRQMMSNPSGAGKVLVEARGSMKAPPQSPFASTVSNVGQAAGKALAEGMSRAPAAADPFAEQRQRVQGLELSQKEQELLDKAKAREEMGKQLNLFT